MYLCTCKREAEKGELGSCFWLPFHRTQPAALTFSRHRAPSVQGFLEPLWQTVGHVFDTLPSRSLSASTIKSHKRDMAGVSADSLREALHPAEYEARTILGGGGRSSLVPGSRSSWGVLGGRIKIASVMALGSQSPWVYLGKNKNSFRYGPKDVFG